VPLSQEIGHIDIKNGRCIVFPNLYQHQVSSFRLADPTKPGHRKILAFFFIDPATRIPSTEIVPPQQQSWWAGSALSNSVLGDLPLLIKEGILEHVDFPMSLEEAKKLRLELMAERSVSNSEVSDEIFDRMAIAKFDEHQLGPRFYRLEFERSVAMRQLALQQYPMDLGQ
ncbi:hypothetical protein GGI21_006136, partial [Coemansia aciculifera]